jgi:hypothetical protein
VGLAKGQGTTATEKKPLLAGNLNDQPQEEATETEIEKKNVVMAFVTLLISIPALLGT